MGNKFSTISDKYAKFRPDYPAAIFNFLYPLLKRKDSAWDCGTGNGQVARELALDFVSVAATDVSPEQIKHAFHAENINYSIQSAEQTTFPNDSFDLITVGQAVHWFDFDRFYEEVKRVGNTNSIIALFGYELNHITPEIDQVVRSFYSDVLGNYWASERTYIQQRYQTIPFPFRELETPDVTNIKLWSLEDLIGYLNTWSAVRQYEKANGNNPVKLIENDLRNAWGTLEVRKVSFPIIFRAGRVK